MNFSSRWGRRVNAILGAAGIAAAAYGAHGLEKIASPEQVRWWTIACALQLVTVPVLLLLFISAESAVASTLSRTIAQGKAFQLAAWFLCAGMLIFSGSLYVMSLGGPRWLGAVTPIGGLLMIVGWLLVARRGKPRGE